MKQHSDPTALLALWLAPFSLLFTSPTWQRMLVLMNGAILASHRRTVAPRYGLWDATIRMGLAEYIRLLSRLREKARLFRLSRL